MPLAAVKPDALDVTNLGQQQAHNTLATTSKPEALGMGYFCFRAGGMMGARPKACSTGSGDEWWVQWSYDHWGIFAPVSMPSQSWPFNLHRSHFGSRYTYWAVAVTQAFFTPVRILPSACCNQARRSHSAQIGPKTRHDVLATTSEPEALGMGYFELWAGGLMGARLEAWSCNNLGQDRNNTFGHPLRIGGFRHGLLQNLGWGFCGGQANSLLHGQRG